MGMKIAEAIVDDIICDLCDRSGLSGIWDIIDEDVKEKIKQSWISIVQNHLGE